MSSPGRRSWAAIAVGVGVPVLGLAVTAFFCQARGNAARSVGPAFPVWHGEIPVHVVDDSAGVLAIWTRYGVHGRCLLHVGRFLHFINPEEPYSEKDLASFPFDFVAEWQAAVSHRDLLWVAMRSGVAREIFNLLPPETLQEKAEAVGDPEVQSITVELRGFRRHLLGRVPPLDEPVLVVIDASVFDSPAAPGMLEALGHGSLRADLVVFNLAADNDAVSPAARRRALDWVATLPLARGRS